MGPMVVLKSLPTRLITMEDSSLMSNTKGKLFTHQNQLRDMVPTSILPREKDTDLHHQNTPQPNHLTPKFIQAPSPLSSYHTRYHNQDIKSYVPIPKYVY